MENLIFSFILNRNASQLYVAAHFIFGTMETVSPLRALEIMRELSRQNIPFDIKFISLNETDKRCCGIKEEKQIILTAGYRRNQSRKSDILVSYERILTSERRQFYFPLLCELNGRKIKP